jgi:hypothetical protein
MFASQDHARVYGSVRRANRSGRLYPVPDQPRERDLVDALVRQGALLPVQSTATSVRGYVGLLEEVVLCRS